VWCGAGSPVGGALGSRRDRRGMELRRGAGEPAPVRAVRWA
jgi:hypothetical protein